MELPSIHKPPRTGFAFARAQRRCSSARLLGKRYIILACEDVCRSGSTKSECFTPASRPPHHTSAGAAQKRIMDRRNFLKTTGTLLAAAAVSQSSAFADTQTAAGRSVLPMNRNWRYHPAKVAGAETVAFDDSSFERVVVPHTNIRLPWHSFDDKDYEFVSTYRRRFKVPEAAAGKRVFVDFEGAMTASTIWINGVSLGEYRGGFTPFSFDLTPHLNQQGDNVLVVQLDSTERADIPPFGYEIDYMTFGGIYREVALRIVPHTYIDNIFARPKDVLTDHPSLEVDCFIAGDTAAPVTLEVELRDGAQ